MEHVMSIFSFALISLQTSMLFRTTIKVPTEFLICMYIASGFFGYYGLPYIFGLRDLPFHFERIMAPGIYFHNFVECISFLEVH